MKELYEELENKYPLLRPPIIFSKLVDGRKMSKNEISKWFLKLIPRQDWVGSPKEELVGFYWRYSNGSK